jgi:hypothetical protein
MAAKSVAFMWPPYVAAADLTACGGGNGTGTRICLIVEDWVDGFYCNLQSGSAAPYANQGFFHITLPRLQGNGTASQLLKSSCFKKLHHHTLTGRSAGGSSIQENPEVSDVWLMFNDPVKSEKWAAGN